jgi:hypothetical protein
MVNPMTPDKELAAVVAEMREVGGFDHFADRIEAIATRLAAAAPDEGVFCVFDGHSVRGTREACEAVQAMLERPTPPAHEALVAEAREYKHVKPHSYANDLIVRLADALEKPAPGRADEGGR